MTSVTDATPLFSFVVLGDTHVNPRDDFSPSPWRTNKLANHRAEAVVAQINVLEPDFVVHLGDMIHPLPGSVDYDTAADRFHQIFGRLNAPLHVVPGNHDLGDKPTGWTPAAHVDEAALTHYRRKFGDDNYAFEHADCQFLVVNDEIFNTCLAVEETQWLWLSEKLSNGRRTFLFAHYPPFLQSHDEVEHYDNLAEPARGRFLDMIRDNVEAVYCGHVHNFFYNRAGTSDIYVAPATSAIRHDYADMFALAPDSGTEHGRDQRSKLGFFFVEVYRDRHVTHFVHSWGHTDPALARAATERPSANPMTRPSPLGVDLRIGWADVHSIAYAGAVDEFNRKPVRNDYLVQALWELGIRHLRVPVRDAIDPSYAKRIRDLGSRGHRFTLFSFGVPDDAAATCISNVSDYVKAVEITCRIDRLYQTAKAAADFRSRVSLPVLLSKLRLSADAIHDGNSFAHFIRHGYRFGEPDVDQSLNLVQRWELDGLVFAVPGSIDATGSIKAIHAFTRQNSVCANVHLQLANENPAIELDDEDAIARRVDEAARAAMKAADDVVVFLDTFCDHDRGYFPRLGLVDRRYDLRAAGNVLKTLARQREEPDARPDHSIIP